MKGIFGDCFLSPLPGLFYLLIHSRGSLRSPLATLFRRFAAKKNSVSHADFRRFAAENDWFLMRVFCTYIFNDINAVFAFFYSLGQQWAEDPTHLN
jgi:hypothetical protein